MSRKSSKEDVASAREKLARLLEAKMEAIEAGMANNAPPSCNTKTEKP
jgi:BMFP domain-containing protein YqiC